MYNGKKPLCGKKILPQKECFFEYSIARFLDFHVMAKPTALSAISIAPTAMASKRNLFSLKARMTNWRKLCKLLKINVISDL